VRLRLLRREALSNLTLRKKCPDRAEGRAREGRGAVVSSAHTHLSNHAEAFALCRQRIQRVNNELVLGLVEVQRVDLDRQVRALLTHHVEHRLRVHGRLGRRRHGASEREQRG